MLTIAETGPSGTDIRPENSIQNTETVAKQRTVNRKPLGIGPVINEGQEGPPTITEPMSVDRPGHFDRNPLLQWVMKIPPLLTTL